MSYFFEVPELDTLFTKAIDLIESQEELDSLESVHETGPGVYIIYFRGQSFDAYAPLKQSKHPIYVGKAVIPGSRTSRKTKILKQEFLIRKRLREHYKSIASTDLDENDFKFKFLVAVGRAAHLIPALESYLINYYQPLWNAVIDGFGNHDPGSGRYQQSKSEWDTLHPGRKWASKLTGRPLFPREDSIAKIKSHLTKLML